MSNQATKPTTVDLRRELGELYRGNEQPALVQVPAIDFLMIDGHGDPNGSAAFEGAVKALYAVAYGLRSRIRALLDGVEVRVMPLEGLWWIPDAQVWDFDDKSDWDWTVMLAEPDVVTPELVDETIATVRARRSLAALDGIRFEPFEEGPAAQVLHRGPFVAERETLARLHEFIKERRTVPVGKHHEIYLTDAQRTAPDRMRTIIRQPVAVDG